VQRPLGSCEQVNCPDLILWQHEGKTGGRPPPHHGCEGSKLFQTRPMILLSIPPPTQPNAHHASITTLHRPPAADSPSPLSPTRNKSATPKVDTAHSHPKTADCVCAPCTPSQWIARPPSHPRFGHRQSSKHHRRVKAIFLLCHLFRHHPRRLPFHSSHQQHPTVDRIDSNFCQ
jgi:hypothetical protein